MSVGKKRITFEIFAVFYFVNLKNSVTFANAKMMVTSGERYFVPANTLKK